MTQFSRAPFYALLSLACAGAPAFARDCGPDSLGVSRTVTIGPKGTAVGLQSYPRTLDLQDHEVVLTFDDGPAAPTAKVLDALAKECARATFFVIGHNAESAPGVVMRAADEGHSIGHHSYSHPGNTLRLMEDGDAKADIEKGIKAVEKASGGRAAPFFRFPGFADTPSLVAYLEAKGYTIFGSDLWASDWSPMSPKGELELVMKRLEKEGKGIVLFHDSKAQTAAMLPDFLRELKARGYRLVHIVPGEGETALMAAGPGWTSTTEPIIAKTLAGKHAAPGRSHGDGAGEEDHAHPPAAEQ
ncbi:polysaccharide deacetylase family protein [Methylocystis sp. JAN1]|uniref:polysaccharide deacetylase family protein n=1 Tax=Methylocystis sp. JAN1 TaxID=3397211 RepID=UPI003FA22D43